MQKRHLSAKGLLHHQVEAEECLEGLLEREVLLANEIEKRTI